MVLLLAPPACTHLCSFLWQLFRLKLHLAFSLEHYNQQTTYSMQLKELKKCSRKKNIKSFLTGGSLRMQVVKLATTADISLSLPICLRGTFQYVTFMHYSLNLFLFMQSIILKCPDCKTKACIKFFTCIFSEAYI